jgi:hypothetical protein
VQVQVEESRQPLQGTLYTLPASPLPPPLLG